MGGCGYKWGWMGVENSLGEWIGNIGWIFIWEWIIDGECDWNVGNMGSVEWMWWLNLRWLSVSATCLIIKDLGGYILLIYPHCIKFSDNFHPSQYSHLSPVNRKSV